MKRLPCSIFVFILSCIMLASCVTPQTFDERLAAGYSTNTSIRVAAASALRADKIDADQGRAVLGLTDKARSLLDVSADGDERGLDLAIEILEELERYFE